MPLDMLVTGRIATLAGATGLGWVEAVGIRDGRIAFAGSEVDLETRADPHTRRIVLERDVVAIPGLTDAHLHLAQAAAARRQVDLSAAATLDAGMAAVAGAHARLSTEPDAWIEGHGWDLDRWGRWPTTGDLEMVAPGRRVALWAHDHHSLLVSRAALVTAAISASTPDPSGGAIRRDESGDPTGILQEAATRFVSVHVPGPDAASLEADIVTVGLELVSLGVVACHDPGAAAPDPELAFNLPAYAALADRDDLPLRVHASVREEGLAAAVDRGLRSGARLGDDPEGRARIGWLKLFADGSLGSRTAALLADIEPEPDAPLPSERRRGLWLTEPERLAELASAAAAAGIATQIHAIGDAAVRAALDVLADTEPVVALMPRLEHVQLLDPADRGRFAAHGIAASVQPCHLGSDAITARRLWGARAEANGYAWATIAATGAVVGFGTDAPVEPIDPWPGLALAVSRADPRWPAGTAPFGPAEAITLDRALRAQCVDPAISAREPDRGRLIPGQRADVVIIPAAAIDDPVEPGGALGTARPSMVLMDGEIVFERA